MGFAGPSIHYLWHSLLHPYADVLLERRVIQIRVWCAGIKTYFSVPVISPYVCPRKSCYLLFLYCTWLLSANRHRQPYIWMGNLPDGSYTIIAHILTHINTMATMYSHPFTLKYISFSNDIPKHSPRCPHKVKGQRDCFRSCRSLWVCVPFPELLLWRHK